MRVKLKFFGHVAAAIFYSFVNFNVSEIILDEDVIIFPTKYLHLSEKINKVIEVVDDEIIPHLEGFHRNGLGLFLSSKTEENRKIVKNEINDAITIFKNNIMDGMYQGHELNKIIDNFTHVHGHVINRDIDGNVKMDTTIAGIIKGLPGRFEEKYALELR